MSLLDKKHPNQIFACECCGDSFPGLHRHVHHKIPQALGGKDDADNLVELCPGCHDTLHKAAYMLVSKKYQPSHAIDAIKFVYKTNPKAVKNCLDLACLVRDSMIAATESESGDPEQLVSLQLTLKRKHKEIIKVYCREKRISMEKYIRSLIIKDLLNKYGVTPSEY